MNGRKSCDRNTGECTVQSAIFCIVGCPDFLCFFALSLRSDCRERENEIGNALSDLPDHTLFGVKVYTREEGGNGRLCNCQPQPSSIIIKNL